MSKGMDQTNSEIIGRVKRREPFSIVPDAILTNKDLSYIARITLAYLIGRPERWDYLVWYVCDQLGLTPGAWKKARRELEKGGYVRQIRKKNDAGRFVWSLVVSDVPMMGDVIESSSIDQNSTDGSPIDGDDADISKEFEQKESDQIDRSSRVVQDKLLIIENDADVILVEAMIEEYGESNVRKAATTLISAGARPYPSFVKKHLAEKKKKEEIEEWNGKVTSKQKVPLDKGICEKGEIFIKNILGGNKISN